jgi:hypothetical protein
MTQVVSTHIQNYSLKKLVAQCKPGTMWSMGDMQCIKCVAGRHQPYSGQAGCAACKRGLYALPGAAECGKVHRLWGEGVSSAAHGSRASPISARQAAVLRAAGLAAPHAVPPGALRADGRLNAQPEQGSQGRKERKEKDALVAFFSRVDKGGLDKVDVLVDLYSVASLARLIQHKYGQVPDGWEALVRP